MSKQNWKVGVAGVLATVLISASSLTGASAEAASDASNLNTAKASLSDWQAGLINNIFNKYVSEQDGYLVVGNWKINIKSGFLVFNPNQNGSGVTNPTPTTNPTATPTATAKPTATPAPTATAKPTATPAPTATAKPTATPAPTATAKPTATPAPTATATPTTTPGSGDTSNVSAVQQEILTLVNQQRAAAGLSALTLDTELNKVAMEKARDMDVNNYFSHTSPTYGSPFDMMRSFGITYTYAGENIASGQTSAKQVMTDWMNSPGHKANILGANFKKLGVGYVNNEWVQMFIG